MTRGGPLFAQNDEAGDRFYTWKDEAFWSVTTIISGGVPKFLHAHYAKMAAELAWAEITARGPNSRSTAIVNRLARAGRAYVAEQQAAGRLTSIKKADRLTIEEAGLRWIKGAAERHRDERGQVGRDVHDEAEELVLEHAREASRLVLAGRTVKRWPTPLAGYQASFENFLDDFEPEYLAAEATVLNRREAFGGTLDAIMRLRVLDQTLVLAVDYKSGAGVYPEVGLQLAPYARGEFIAGADGVTEFPLPAELDQKVGAVLWLRPKPTPSIPRGYRLRLVRIDEPIWDAFRFAREVYRFQKDLAGTVFLQDLSPTPEPEEVPA